MFSRLSIVVRTFVSLYFVHNPLIKNQESWEGDRGCHNNRPPFQINYLNYSDSPYDRNNKNRLFSSLYRNLKENYFGYQQNLGIIMLKLNYLKNFSIKSRII